MNLTQREEQYFAKMGGLTETAPAPITRTEQFLANAANGGSATLTPMTEEEKVLNSLAGRIYPEPSGTKSITANANGIDVKDYAKVNVNVPNPSTGTKSITENGEGIDVKDYAKVDVNVPNGGDSDFSTAEVTIGGSNSFTLFSPRVYLEETKPYIICLYENVSPEYSFVVPITELGLLLSVDCFEEGIFEYLTVSGNAEKMEGGIAISGDCTISLES